MALFKIHKGLIADLKEQPKKEGYAYVAKIDDETASFFVDYDDNTRLQVGKYYGLVTDSEDGLVPKFEATSGTIESSSNDWVLTNKNGSLGWYQLPENAFKNDNTNTTYTLSGAAKDNTWVTTLTPSSGTATTSIVPAATTDAAGLMTPAMVTKLNGIAEGATTNNGTITGVTAGDGLSGGATSGEATLSAKLGLGLKFDDNKNIVVNTDYVSADKNYAVKTDASGALYVNVPWLNTNTHYTTGIQTGDSQATTNATDPVTDPYITVTDNDTYRSQIQLKGAGSTTISADDGIITITSTDTTYSPYTGASSTADGSTGLVPKPTQGQEGYYLRGDGKWFNLTEMDSSVQENFQALKTAWEGADTSLRNTLTTLINGKAATKHASNSDSYGLSTESLYGHAMASSTTPKASATTAVVGNETAKFARGDHVHPLSITHSWSGNTLTTKINDISKTVDIPTATTSAAGLMTTDMVTQLNNIDTTYLKLSGGTLTGKLTLPAGTDAYTNASLFFGTTSKIGTSTTTNVLGLYSTGKIMLRPNDGTMGYSHGFELSTTDLIPTQHDTVTLGNNTHKWANVYATTFTGDLLGTATKATQDGSGNVITDTYLPLAGGTMTGDLKFTTNGIHFIPGNTDQYLWKVYSSVDGSHGFRLQYNGTGVGNNNSLSLIADNETGEEVKAVEVLQDGTITFTKNMNTAQIHSTTASGVSFAFTESRNNGPSVSFGVGSGNINHGVYSNTLGKWIVYADASKIYLNGNALTATKLAAGKTFKVNLASTNASSTFDGSSNITDIGVSGTLAVTNGGTGNNETLTANRFVWSESTTKMTTSGTHYINSTKIAVNSTSQPTENFYVNGSVRFGIGSNDNVSNKRFIIGTAGNRYLAFGGAGIQAYNASDAGGALHLQYQGGNIIIGQSTSVTAPMTIHGIIMPGTNNTYTLGTSSYNWSTVNARALTSAAALAINSADTTTVSSASTIYLTTNSASSILFTTNETVRGRWSPNGKFIIGTKNESDYKLDVTGTSFFSDTALFDAPPVVRHSGSRYGYIYFQNDAGLQMGAIGHDVGNSVTVQQSRFFFREYSANATNDTSRTDFYETYYLPASTDGLTANKTYNILTTKNTITIAQGGTGATDAAGARINLGTMSAVDANGFYGMGIPDGSTNVWIRTTTLGIIPYQSGGASALGTSSWRFNNAYINTVYGDLDGNAKTATTLKNSRLFNISSTPGTTGTSFNGSADVTLIIPSTVKTFTELGTNKISSTDALYITPASTLYLDSAASTSLIFRPQGTEKARFNTSGNFLIKTDMYPGTNNTYNLGTSSYRWKNIYSTSGNFSGDVTLTRSTTIANNTPAKLIFTVTQTDNSVSSSGYIACYDDLDANGYGVNMVVNATSGLYLTAGEGAASYLANNASVSENVHICADSAIYFHTNCNTVTNATTSCYINTSGYIYGARVYGAVWNDYAEYRATTVNEPGRVVQESKNGIMILTTERLQPGCEIISDTFGFAIGETEKCKTPIAATGRVLAYTYENRDSYELGQAVCSGPNGTVSKMTREEIITYPERIIGTVSEIPTYETWGTDNIAVNGRIWIRIK